MPALALRLLPPLALLLVGPAHAAQVTVHAERHGSVPLVEASAKLRHIWQVLSDHDRLAQFIPGMRVSRILARNGNSLLVEQQDSGQVRER